MNVLFYCLCLLLCSLYERQCNVDGDVQLSWLCCESGAMQGQRWLLEVSLALDSLSYSDVCTLQSKNASAVRRIRNDVMAHWPVWRQWGWRQLGSFLMASGSFLSMTVDSRIADVGLRRNIGVLNLAWWQWATIQCFQPLLYCTKSVTVCTAPSDSCQEIKMGCIYLQPVQADSGRL